MASICDLKGKKPQISYPCEWEYKILTLHGENVSEMLKRILGDKNFSLDKSKISSKGKYQSHNLRLKVKSEEERSELFLALKSDQNIKFVL